MKEYLLFKKMLTPLLLQLLFWPAVGASIYYSTWLIVHGYRVGWIPLIVGTLSIRVLFEMLLTSFRSYEKLHAIEHFFHVYARTHPDDLILPHIADEEGK